MIRPTRLIATVMVGVVVVFLFNAMLGSTMYMVGKEAVKWLINLANEHPITVLVYETESMKDSPANQLIHHMSRVNGIEAYIFGNGEGFEGYGSKYAAVYPILQKLPSDRLVIISDGRDVLFNNPSATDKYDRSVVAEFRNAFRSLTSRQYSGAVVVSAEAQCCVSALTHVTPGSYYNEDGTRNERACSSGEENCLWKGTDQARPWETFMQSLAMKRVDGKQKLDDVYLNAGLMAGTAKDLIRLIEHAQIGKDEDDQAVLTDYMFRYPNSIVLDYSQTMFGNNRGGLSNNMLSYEDNKDNTCMFHLPDRNGVENVAHDRLIHSKTKTAPLFIHSPGGYLQCHDELIQKLGYNVIAAKTRRRLSGTHWTGCNYSIMCLRQSFGGGFNRDSSRFGQRFRNHDWGN